MNNNEFHVMQTPSKVSAISKPDINEKPNLKLRIKMHNIVLISIGIRKEVKAIDLQFGQSLLKLTNKVSI